MNDPALPVYWGANEPGMSARCEVKDTDLAREAWHQAGIKQLEAAELLNDIGLHKQITNRVLESHQFTTEVITGTEWDNFYHLRLDKHAQPEMQEIARVIKQAIASAPTESLDVHDYHLPFIKQQGTEYFSMVGELEEALTLEEAINVSMSVCAQASFRIADGSLEKANRLNDMLLFSDPVNASPSEHIATPFSEQEHALRKGLADRLRDFYSEQGDDSKRAFLKSDHVNYSGNLRGFTQYRKTIPNETYVK
jgi:hypothetical protein